MITCRVCDEMYDHDSDWILFGACNIHCEECDPTALAALCGQCKHTHKISMVDGVPRVSANGDSNG